MRVLSEFLLMSPHDPGHDDKEDKVEQNYQDHWGDECPDEMCHGTQETSACIDTHKIYIMGIMVSHASDLNRVKHTVGVK